MKHIIHVDNSDFFRKLMKTFLSEQGLISESFERGNDVIAAVKAGKVNCVITGLELADMSGEEFIKRLTVSGRAVPVIVVTSTKDAAKARRLGSLGVKAVIDKAGNWQEELRKIL
jgi:two-component system cell cycle response regulator